MEWLGQIHKRSGLAPDTVGRWTARLGQGAGNSVHAANIHAEASAIGLQTSPLSNGRLQTVTVLPPGQLALLPEVDLSLPPGSRLTGRILLVRGVDALGRNGTSRCLLCSRGSCPIGSHAPMPAAGGKLTVESLRPLRDGAGVFISNQHVIQSIDSPNRLVFVSPFVFDLDGSRLLLPIVGFEGERRDLARATRLPGGRPITLTNWLLEMKRQQDFWDDKTRPSPWHCSHCLEGSLLQAADLLSPGVHASCAGYERRLRLLLGGDKRWVCRRAGEDCSPSSVLLPAPVPAGGTVVTDASATVSASGVALVDGGTGAKVLVRIAGRPSERGTSFFGEVLGGVLVPQQLAASGRWLGDNSSALDIGTAVGGGWDYGD